MTYKKCTDCGCWLSPKEFARDRSRKDGLNSKCRQCSRIRSQRHYQENRQQYRRNNQQWRRHNRDSENQQSRQRRHRDPAKRMVYGARSRARAIGLECSITPEKLIPLPHRCPVLGIELKNGDDPHDPHAYSLDRINSFRGYTPDNVQVISHRANSLKRDAALSESVALAYYQAEQTDHLTPLMETAK